MNKNAAIVKLPVKQDITKHNSPIITYLDKSNNRTGAAYLYKTVYKNFKPLPDTATVYCIQLPLDKKFNRLIKRGMDVFLAVLVIAGLLSWLIPVLAVLIKTSSKGPVFFRQKRNKQNGGIFTCIKFRSMVVNNNADELPAARNDKRITGIGRFIRKTYIDELPQFFNVLMGDMSVIGPRPHMLSEHFKFQKLVPHYGFREKVKPGITGLSQVVGLEGAADTINKMHERITVDNFYIRHWSPKMDSIIFLRTIGKLLTQYNSTNTF